MKIFLTLLFSLIAAVASAQPSVDARTVFVGATGSACVVRSGTGVPGSGLGAVCDTYYRKDSPYTMYVKTGASTWSPVLAIDSVATGQVLASNGTGVPPVYTASPSITTLTVTGAASPNGINMSSTNPVFRMIDTDATADNGYWRFRADAEAFLMSTMNDANTVVANWLRVERTGTTVDSITWAGPLTQPDTGYFHNLGSLSRKYLTLHAAELWVETLVAQNTIATIGGRVLIGPTTTLTSDLTSGATSIIVKHNQMVSGDRAYMEANGSVEFLAITSNASGSGPYTYTVTRDLDGTGANAWVAGDAVFNTGQVGSGFIDLFSMNSATFAGLQAIFNYDAALTTFSSNYVDTDIVPFLGNSANDTVNDAIYFGSPASFGNLSAYVLTPLSLGTGTAVWEFWDGSAWTSFTPTGAGFSVVGPGLATTGTLTGWTTTTINSVSAYWLRYRVTAVGSGITAGSWRLVRRGQQQWGPTIIGNVRTTSTYNDWYPRWAIGNLQGTYGYSTAVYGAGFGDEAASNIVIDATNGIRIRSGTTNKLIMNTAGDLILTGNIYGTATSWASGTGYVLEYNAGSPRMRLGAPSSGDRLQWSGTALSLVSAETTIDATGIQLGIGGTVSTIRSYKWDSTNGRMQIQALGGGSSSRDITTIAEWNGTGDLASGSGTVSIGLSALHNPSSGGTSKSASATLLTSSTSSIFTITAEAVNVTSTNTWDFSTDLRIYGNNGTTTGQPYIRSDGNYLVIEARSTANGGTIYLANDNSTHVNLTGGGGTTTINRAAINTSLVLAGLASCTLQVDGAGSVGCVSDAAAKTDIKSWSPGLDAITKLRPVSYKWRAGDTDTHIGFIAQEVDSVIPDAVRAQSWGSGLLTLDDRAILAALVNAVKELQRKSK